MVQFYFLAILMNILAGMILIFGKNYASEDDMEEDTEIISKASLDTKEVRLITGILAFFTGAMKILSVFRNDIPVIGDLLPALGCIAGGASILAEYVISASTDNPIPEHLSNFLIGGRKYIGVFCLTAALLHFIFPQVVLL